MDFYLILQVFFDAVLLFGILFLFHFSVHHSQKKNEESDMLKNIQVQDIKENLQELLMTLKQLGKEVSDNIQEQVREAEEKTEIFKKAIQKSQKDLNKTLLLAEEVGREKSRLEDKIKIIQTAKKMKTKNSTFLSESFLKTVPNDEITSGASPGKVLKSDKSNRLGERGNSVGFSSGLVREVYRMVDSDMDLNEIVRKTRLSRAEVQLILNLRDNRFTTPN